MEITDELQKIMDKYNYQSIDEINWNNIVRREILSEKFMETYSNKLDLYLICFRQKLSEKFIEIHFNKLYLNYICEYQKLSEKFMNKYFDKLDINKICLYQKLSEKFIEKYFNKFSKYNTINICVYQNISEKFAKKHKLDIKLYNKIHKQISYKQKIEEVKKYCEKYNLEFDYKNRCFYAYREHDQRGNGMFNKAIFYEKGEYYKDWHLDMSKNKEDSFGLGIFPSGNTKIKVLIEDWGVEINRDDGKCRVWGFEIV